MLYILQGTSTNAEYEAEKKAEQEKKEKALGVLKYLGQSSSEGDYKYLKYWIAHFNNNRLSNDGFNNRFNCSICITISLDHKVF